MMKLLMKLSLVMMVTGGVLEAVAQSTIKFEYDASGNRERRYQDLGEREADESVINLADSLQEAFLAQDKVYPNPTEGIVKFALKLEEPASSRVTVFDLNGRMMYRKTFHAQDFEIDITEQRIGIYLVKWQFADQIRTLKIIKN